MTLVKIRKWFGLRKLRPENKYEEEKREFEMAIGKPFIHMRIEIPEGFENLRAQFLNLESDEQFLEEVRDLIKKRLQYEKRGIKPPS